MPKLQPVALITNPEDTKHYDEARQCVEELALYLKPLSSVRGKRQKETLPILYQMPLFQCVVLLKFVVSFIFFGSFSL